MLIMKELSSYTTNDVSIWLLHHRNKLLILTALSSIALINNYTNLLSSSFLLYGLLFGTMCSKNGRRLSLRKMHVLDFVIAVLAAASLKTITQASDTLNCLQKISASWYLMYNYLIPRKKEKYPDGMVNCIFSVYDQNFVFYYFTSADIDYFLSQDEVSSEAWEMGRYSDCLTVRIILAAFFLFVTRKNFPGLAMLESCLNCFAVSVFLYSKLIDDSNLKVAARTCMIFSIFCAILVKFKYDVYHYFTFADLMIGPINSRLTGLINILMFGTALCELFAFYSKQNKEGSIGMKFNFLPYIGALIIANYIRDNRRKHFFYHAIGHFFKFFATYFMCSTFAMSQDVDGDEQIQIKKIMLLGNVSALIIRELLENFSSIGVMSGVEIMAGVLAVEAFCLREKTDSMIPPFIN